MSEFTLHTPDSAPEAARAILQSAQKQTGFVPNLYANLANAPAALEAYLGLGAQFDKTSFNPVERQVNREPATLESGRHLRRRRCQDPQGQRPPKRRPDS